MSKIVPLPYVPTVEVERVGMQVDFSGNSGTQDVRASVFHFLLPYIVRLFSPKPVGLSVIDEAQQLWRQGKSH